MTKKFWACLLIVAFILSGCSSVPVETTASDTSGNAATVGDIFTTPIQTTVPATTADNEAAIPTASHTEKSILDGSARFQNSWQTHVYTGRETAVPYQIYMEGADVERDGVGVLLLLDGLPQPYRTDYDDTYRYMHTFHPKSGVETIEQLYFIPVTGQQGDALELQACPILFPNANLGGAGIVSHSIGALNGFRAYDRMLLKLEQTPPLQKPVAVKERMRNWSSSSRSATTTDYPNGVDEQYLKENVLSTLWVNNEAHAGGRYNHTADAEVNLHLEVFGVPGVEYTMVLYVDHEPVSIAPENVMHARIENGQINLTDVALDLSDFDGDTLVYALYAVTNAEELGWPLNGNVISSFNQGYYYFFISHAKPEK